MKRAPAALLERARVRESGGEGEGQGGAKARDISRGPSTSKGRGDGVHVCIGERICMWHACTYVYTEKHICAYAWHALDCMYVCARTCVHGT